MKIKRLVWNLLALIKKECKLTQKHLRPQKRTIILVFTNSRTMEGFTILWTLFCPFTNHKSRMYRNSRIHEQIFHFFTNSPTKISIFTNHERFFHEFTNEKRGQFPPLTLPTVIVGGLIVGRGWKSRTKKFEFSKNLPEFERIRAILENFSESSKIIFQISWIGGGGLKIEI